MAGSLTIDNINGKVISSSPVATESQVIGVGQTWKDVTASRAAGTTYTNSTGKPIQVLVSWTGTTNTDVSATLNGLTTAPLGGTYNLAAVYVRDGISIIIPNGNTYSITNVGGTIVKWFELR